MKKTRISVCLILSLSVGILPLSARQSTTDYIVSVDGDPYALSELTAHLLGGTVGYVYDTLMNGFQITLPDNADLDALPFVESYWQSGSFLACDVTDTDTADSVTADDMSAAEMIGYTDTLSLDGNGTVVAVLDTGFDVTHNAFQAEVHSPVLTKEAVDTLVAGGELHLASLTDFAAGQIYKNSKVPFVYDYAGKDHIVTTPSNHGTHVAGIIGAMATEQSDMHGIAPACQMLFMKVFDDDGAFASDSAIIAALEDAVKLGADVINMSLGHYAGSADVQMIAGMKAVLEKAEENGCIIVCAAGNESVASEYTSQNSMTRNSVDNTTSLTPVTYTDYGTVNYPASLKGSIAVASVENNVVYGVHFRDSLNNGYPYTDTNVVQKVSDSDFSVLFDGRTLTCVTVPNIGEEKDYNGLNVRGKLVLVQRGELTFTEKAEIAASHGAVGMIVYNNIEEKSFSMQLTDSPIPAVSISRQDGLTLAANKKNTLTFRQDFTSYRNPDGGRMSYYSSYGCTPSLTLKPDITAVGGNVKSTVPDGYGILSGTSMATPQISGVVLLLCQKYRTIPRAERIDRFTSLLLNTAVPVLQSDGIEYSPRRQGAGMVQLDALLSAMLEVTYTPTGEAKASLYDGIGSHIEVDVTVKNMTDTTIDVSAYASILCDGYQYQEATDIDPDAENLSDILYAVVPTDGYYYTFASYADSLSRVTVTADSVQHDGNVNRNAADYTPFSLTLMPQESNVVTFVFDFDKTQSAELDRIFTNGRFLEGYLYFDTAATSVSLPYMGYHGDFTVASAIDDTAEIYGGSKLTTTVGGKKTVLDSDLFGGDKAAVFSPNFDGCRDEIRLYAPQLRNITSASMSVTDALGNEVYRQELTDQYTEKEKQGAGSNFVFTWNGSDGINRRYILPDGNYTMTVDFVLDYLSDTHDTHSVHLCIDTERPQITEYRLSGSTCHVTASDNIEIAEIRLYESDKDDAYTAVCSGLVRTDSESGRDVVTTEFDLSDCPVTALYLEVTDTAGNRRILPIPV